VLAQDVTFLGSAGEGGERAPRSEASNSGAAKKDDIVIDEIPDEPIDLSEIPF
jgi:hypothetical protein